jgi:hypothetical protein
MLIRIVASFSLAACLAISVGAQNSSAPANLAAVAKASASGVSDDTSLAALNDGYAPRNSRDNRHGSYGNWPDTGTQWVEYDWSQPVSTKQIEVYWWDDHQGVRLPGVPLEILERERFHRNHQCHRAWRGGRSIQCDDVSRNHHDEAAAGNGRP